MKNLILTGKRKDVVNMLLDILLILEDVNHPEDINMTIPMSKYPSVVIEPADKSCPMVNCNGRESGIRLRQAEKIIRELLDVYENGLSFDYMERGRVAIMSARQFIGD